ncbi:MAG: alpha/beta fold hydrolase [Thermoanaerobaculia bacterium]
MARSEQVRTDTLVAVSADVRLRVIEAGPPDAQPIVFVPGWCFTADIWNKQIAALSDRYHVVAFDPRSQGRSTVLDHSNSPDDRAQDIAALIKMRHLKKPVLVGWSQGVQDVAAYALAFGTGDVGGLVLVDAAVSAGAGGLNATVATMTLGRMPIYAGSQREYLEGMMPYLFKTPLSPSERNGIVTAAQRTPTSIGVANLTLDLFGRDYRPAFKRMGVPTLLIVAGTAPDKNEQLAQPIPTATSAVVEDAGHAVFYDKPAPFNDLLVRFLDERVKGPRSR